MKIGDRNYFICLGCGKLFSCSIECNEPSDYCYCNRCVRATIRCDTRRENNKTIEMLIRVNGKYEEE